MIFVTVGTHEQAFNRLVKFIDNLKKDGIIEEEVVIQTGFSTYEPQKCTWSSLYPYKEMIKFVNEARIVITHGGPSSFIMPLQLGKIPVVVPRQKNMMSMLIIIKLILQGQFLKGKEIYWLLRN